jgi:hypothetical protein
MHVCSSLIALNVAFNLRTEHLSLVAFNLRYAKTSYINRNETNVALEP